MKCPGCGATNSEGSLECNYCSKKFSAAQSVDSSVKQSPATYAAPFKHEVEEQASTSQTKQTNYDDLSNWYKEVFTKFDNDPSSGLKMKFSWPAFLFGPFWYLSKGLWAKALIYLAVALVSGGTLVIFAWIYASIFGIYDFYLLKKFGKQLW
jgi:hypothetical protein